MNAHIWAPLDIKVASFRPKEHELVRSRLCSMTAKTPSGELVPSPPVRKMDNLDDLGGGGLYTSPNEYIKLLTSLLKNDGTLLRPETVMKMFEPQLPDDKYIRGVISDPANGPMFKAGVESVKWNFGLGGIINMEDVDGICKKGTMTWGGLPNLFWVSPSSVATSKYAFYWRPNANALMRDLSQWIDPAAGTCGMYASQLVPPGDSASLALAVAFRRDMYKRLAKL